MGKELCISFVHSCKIGTLRSLQTLFELVLQFQNPPLQIRTLSAKYLSCCAIVEQLATFRLENKDDYKYKF